MIGKGIVVDFASLDVSQFVLRSVLVSQGGLLCSPEEEAPGRVDLKICKLHFSINSNQLYSILLLSAPLTSIHIIHYHKTINISHLWSILVSLESDKVALEGRGLSLGGVVLVAEVETSGTTWRWGSSHHWAAGLILDISHRYFRLVLVCRLVSYQVGRLIFFGCVCCWV